MAQHHHGVLQPITRIT